MKNLLRPFFEPTPRKFRIIRSICVAIGAAAAAGYMAPKDSLPAISWLQTAIQYGGLMGLLGIALSSYQTESKKEDEK